MTLLPSASCAQIFPGPRIPAVLAYVTDTWEWLRQTFVDAVGYDQDETALTDNLCEALSDYNRRYKNAMDCDFQSETWELRRGADGKTVRIARADIRVILGVPGTPHFVLEFKKLDGSSGARWRYCFDGMNRFVEGNYAGGHAFGAMCGLACVDPDNEVTAMAGYISQSDHARRLNCVANSNGSVVTLPSATDPAHARFDTTHERSPLGSASHIVLLHVFMPCSAPVTTATRLNRRKPVKRTQRRRLSGS